MTALDLKNAFYDRNFYRFTGPPENWLTAIKYMTWGLEQKYLDLWNRILEGDVFLMHSTTQSLFYKKPISSIVGLGVVGGMLRNKENPLWVQEIQSKQNIWPLLVPFSEIYLFSEMPDVNTWEAPGLSNNQETEKLIHHLLKNAVPLASFSTKFPVMGSWSSVRSQLVDALFSKAQPVLYNEFYSKDSDFEVQKKPAFHRLNKAEEEIRFVPSLKFLDGDKVKVRESGVDRSVFDRDNAVLERAEENHQEILQAAINFFKKNGFDTWWNKHVDLLAEAEDRSFLVEVKSTLNSNFRTQARKAVGQLLEYEYFDVRRYYEEHSRNISVNKLLMVSDDPNERDYTTFLSSLNVQLAWSKGTHISCSGEGGQLASLIQN